MHRLSRLCRAALFGLLWLSVNPALAQTPVFLELVLAVDCSSSVSNAEFELQMQGLARAFEHPDVLGALENAGATGIAVAMLQWSGADKQVRAIDWYHISDAAAAEAFAGMIDATPRFVDGGATAIGTAMRDAVDWLAANDYVGQRKVIDVSGDGRANQGESPAFVRAAATAQGITINGVAILNEEPRLARYYAAGVVGGDGAFLLTADDYEDFARAIRKKLFFEIVGPPIVQAPRTGPQNARR